MEITDMDNKPPRFFRPGVSALQGTPAKMKGTSLKIRTGA